MHLLLLPLTFFCLSLLSYSIHPPPFFPSNAPTLSIHFIFLQFSLPFLFACLAHPGVTSLFLSLGEEVAKREGPSQKVTDDTQTGRASAPDGHESFGFAKQANIPVHHVAAQTSDRRQGRLRQHSARGNHTWPCHKLFVHMQHLHDLHTVVWF